MAWHADTMDRQTQSFTDEQIDDREADRNSGTAVDHTVEVAVFQFVVILRVTFETLLSKQIPVERLNRLFAGRARADTVLNFLRHFIELADIDRHIERRR